MLESETHFMASRTFEPAKMTAFFSYYLIISYIEISLVTSLLRKIWLHVGLATLWLSSIKKRQK